MDQFNFFTEEQYKKLTDNGKPENCDQNHAPVVKLFLPYTNCVWLLSELDPEGNGIAFGLCDLGLGYPELGYVSLQELSGITNLSLSVTCDNSFEGKYPMSVYCDAARSGEQISTDEVLLQKYNVMHQAKMAKKDSKPQPG